MRDKVPLKVDAYVHRLVVPHGLPAPYAGIIFFEIGYAFEALALDPRFGLAFGKAIRASNRCGGIRRGVWRIDRRVLASLFAGFMLVCAITGMAEATNKTAIIDLRIGFPFFGLVTDNSPRG